MTFEDPVVVHSNSRATVRAALMAKKAKEPGSITNDDIHSLLELVLDGQDDLLARK